MKDVAIIGAGPVGLFAVFQCGMLGLTTALIDGLPAVGGQCRALYAEKPIYDIPACPAILAGELVDRLWAQAEPFAPSLYLGNAVYALERGDGFFTVYLTNGDVLKARCVLVAAGAGAFVPNRPPLDAITEFENKSVFYFVDHIEQYRNKHVVIAGGGDSAIDWAVLLSNVTTSTTIVHRRPQFRASPDSVAKVMGLVAEGKIRLCAPAQLKSLDGSEGLLNHVHITHDDRRDEALRADILLPFFGLLPSLGSIESWGLDICRKTITVNPLTCATNKEGIYAVGDIAGYPHKLKLIVTGFSESAQAAHAIYEYLNPDKPLHFVHSTDKGITALRAE